VISAKTIDESVAAIATSRNRRIPLEHLPPGGGTLEVGDAYAIQEAFVRSCGLKVVGYKIGCASRESQALVGASGPFAARIFAPTRFDSPAQILVRDFFSIGVEAEFGFTMGAPLAPRGPMYGRTEVARAIAAVAPVIEICDTRLQNWRAARIEEIIADNGFHGGLVVGPAIPQWESIDLTHCEVTLSIDGVTRGQGASEGTLGDPLDGLVWIANELARRGYGLKANDIVATGTWTGLHFVREPSAVVVADFGALGRVELRVRAR